MKVKELIEQLRKLDPNLEVLASCEDVGVVVPGYFVRPFEVGDVSEVNVEIGRDEKDRRTICAVAAGEGQKFAIIEVTSVF